jgi:hypothetical protein
MNNIPHTIEIVIDENGKISTEVKGVTGKVCTDLSKFLDGLGTVERDEHTPDYYKPAKQGLTIKAK